MRILTYNSSARGSGQFVRSLKLAHIVTGAFHDARCLIIAGNGIVERQLPPRTEVVALPPIRKSLAGDFVVGTLAGQTHQSTDLSDVFAIRRRVIESTVEQFKPDVFLVDTRPKGLNGELLGILDRRVTMGPQCRTVLMLRDIVDDPLLVVQRWLGDGTYTMIDEVYDNVIILGNKSVFDAVERYQLTRFRDKTFHLGYLGDSRTDAANRDQGMSSARPDRILVTVGGGFDGGGIIDTVCQYVGDRDRKNQHIEFTIVLGTHSPLTAAELRGRYSDIAHHAVILRHVNNLGKLIAEASLVVSMCGYNTLIELIERGKKIIAIPRGHSGREQTTRADVLKNVYDGMWVISENNLTAETLGRMVDVVLAAPPPTVRVKMEGAANLIRFLSDEVWRDR